jgi:hypothetical protein
MKKLRLVAAVALLTAALLGAFGPAVQAHHNPSCWDEYVACNENPAFPSTPGDCYCFYMMCMHGDCP